MHRLSFTLIFLLVGGISFSQDRNTGSTYDRFIQQGMEDWQIPGVQVAVVKNGEVVFQKSYGITNIGTKEKVNDETIFAMASTTKAFIAMAIGMLVDEGKINWNDPVIDHYPEFRLHDPIITRETRVIDLLTHNMGLPNADYLWAFDSLSTRVLLEEFATVEPAYSMRSNFIYQNIMYVIAGEVIEAVSGNHWSDFVANRIFNPLKMYRSTPKSADIYELENFTYPHKGEWITDPGNIDIIPHTLADQVGAAGMMWSCISDITHYLEFLVNNGIYQSDTLLSKSTFDKLFEPQTVIPEANFYPTTALTKPHWTTYGLGWFQQDYKGMKLDFHTGSLGGLIAEAAVIRDEDFAFYFFGNLDHAEFRHAAMFKAIDLFVLNDNSTDWNKKVFELYDKSVTKGKEQREKRNSERVENTSPSFELADFSGDYIHNRYGKMTVATEEGQLKLSLNEYRSWTLDHWHYNTFHLKDMYWDLLLYFQAGPDGKVAELNIFGETFIKKGN